MGILREIRTLLDQAAAGGGVPVLVHVPEIRRNELVQDFLRLGFRLDPRDADHPLPTLVHGVPFEYGGDTLRVETA